MKYGSAHYEPVLEDFFKDMAVAGKGRSLDFPVDILCLIASYVQTFPSSQRNLWTMTMVSRAWYSAAIELLYYEPQITGKNFLLFVRTLCPSINRHIRKTDFSSMVKVLDMSKLVHDGSKSLTSRILGRLRDGLKVFIAPQSSFAQVKLRICYFPEAADMKKVSIAWPHSPNATIFGNWICPSPRNVSASPTFCDPQVDCPNLNGSPSGVLTALSVRMRWTFPGLLH